MSLIQQGDTPQKKNYLPQCPIPGYSWKSQTPDGRIPRHLLALAAFAAKMVQAEAEVINYTPKQGAEIILEFYGTFCPMRPEHEIATIAIKGISKLLGEKRDSFQITMKGAKRHLRNYIQEDMG